MKQTGDRRNKTARVIIAIVTLIAWLALSGIGGPTFGKIAEVSSNDQATFLPANAESTRASEWVQNFSDSNQIPALVVTEFDQALQEEVIGQMAAVSEQIKAVEGVDQVIGPVPAEDMMAVQFIVLIGLDQNSGGDADSVVEQLRGALSSDNLADLGLPNGDNQVFHVTGPAGIAADLASAFAGIDGILLLVALAIVLIILVVVYRSILLPILVIFTSMAALCGAILAIYWMARWEWIALNGQAQGILSILVIGATTDYSLLLVARTREELLRHRSVFDAMKKAVHGSLGAISASAATVAIALLCLLVSDLNSNRSLGPIAATGIVFAWGAALTMLPALLLLLGRGTYWPSRPKFNPALAQESDQEQQGDVHPLWDKVAAVVSRYPRKVWAITLFLLCLGALFVPTLKAEGVATTDILLGDTDAKAGQAVLNQHFAAGSGSPTTVIVPEEKAEQAQELITGLPGVASSTLTAEDGSPAGVGGNDADLKVVDGAVYLQTTLADPADSAEAEATVVELRNQLHQLDPQILVGGTTATAIDSNATSQRDLNVIIPLVLLVVLVILIILLRAIVLPILLIVATVVSFGTALGTAALVFNHILKFPGADPSVPLYGFVFLVALGIDYTIFLMTRAREETPALGTRGAVIKALTVTGGVITSAGIVLAATFAALVVIPLMFMIQLAFIVAYGVLIDTLIVRTLLIPAVVTDIGPNVWWPWRKQVEPTTK